MKDAGLGPTNSPDRAKGAALLHYSSSLRESVGLTDLGQYRPLQGYGSSVARWRDATKYILPARPRMRVLRSPARPVRQHAGMAPLTQEPVP